MRGRRSIPVLTCAIVCAVLVALGAAAGARPQQSVDEKIRDVQGMINETSADEAAALQEYVDAKARKDAADARVRDASGRAGAANDVLKAAEAEVEAATLRLGATIQRVSDADAAQQQSQQLFASAAARRYRQVSGAMEESVATPSGDESGDLSIERIAERYLRDLSGHEDQEIQRYLELKEQAEAERAALEVQTKELEARRADAAAEAARVQAIQKEEQAARDVVAAEAAAEKRTVDALDAKKDQYEAQLKTLQAESDRLAKELASRQTAGVQVAKGSGQFKRPVEAPISSPFGYRIHPIYRTKRLHTGMDFSASMGTPIKAAGSGTVVTSGSMGGYGNAVVIDHGNGLATLYAHQSRLGVKVGDKVSTGAVIGYVGSTGASTGPHLHFEVRAAGTPVDPAPYL